MSRFVLEAEPGAREGMNEVRVPGAPLKAAALLVLLTVGFALLARTTGVGATREPVVPALEARSIRLHKEADGSLSVWDSAATLPYAHLTQNDHGFLLGALNGLRYKRDLAQADQEALYHLTRWQDGRVSLDDPITGIHIAVNSFGPTQVASFEVLFNGTTP